VARKNDIHLPRVNTGYGVKYKIPKLWNELLIHVYLKEQSSINMFENKLKLYLITKLYNDN